MLNWDDMRVFLAVARAEGLSGAAPGLKMDPATLGRRVNRLETAVGAPLFVKSPQGYALTDLGQRMRDQAAEAEDAFARAMDEGQGGARGSPCGSENSIPGDCSPRGKTVSNQLET